MESALVAAACAAVGGSISILLSSVICKLTVLSNREGRRWLLLTEGVTNEII
jgi:hypothetical protein